MHSFEVKCFFEGREFPVTFYIEQPRKGCHPIHYQSEWLKTFKNGICSSKAMESFTKFQEIAEEYSLNFEELFLHAVNKKDNTPTTLVEPIDDKTICFQNALDYTRNQGELAESGRKKHKKYKDSLTRISDCIKAKDSLFLYEEKHLQTEIFHDFVRYIFPEGNFAHPKAEKLLLAMLESLATDPAKQLTLREVFLNLFFETQHFFAVIMDTLGGYLPGHAFAILDDILSMKPAQSDQVFASAGHALLDACFNPRPCPDLPIEDWFEPLRQFLVLSQTRYPEASITGGIRW